MEDPRCASYTCMAWCTFYPAKTASFEKIDRVWKTSFHDPLECRELWSFQRARASDRSDPLFLRSFSFFFPFLHPFFFFSFFFRHEKCLWWNQPRSFLNWIRVQPFSTSWFTVITSCALNRAGLMDHDLTRNKSQLVTINLEIVY